jgi:hypothetical protein
MVDYREKEREIETDRDRRREREREIDRLYRGTRSTSLHNSTALA